MALGPLRPFEALEALEAQRHLERDVGSLASGSLGRPSHSMSLNEFLTWLRRLRCLHFRRTWQKYEEAPGVKKTRRKASGPHSTQFLVAGLLNVDGVWMVFRRVGS